MNSRPHPASELKVVHIAPTPFFSDRGCHIRIMGMLHGLEPYQVSNIVCTYHHGNEVMDIDTRRIGNIKRYTRTGAGPDPWKLWADVKLLWLTLKTVWTEKPDLIHGHLHEGAMIGWLVRWLTIWRRTPVFADIQGSLTGELDTFDFFAGKPWLVKIFQLIESVIVRMPVALTCSSLSSYDQLKEIFNLPEERLLLAEDGLDDRMEFDRPSNRSSETVTLLYSGSLLEGKGVRHLQEILKQVLEHHKNVRALIIGYPIEDVQAWLAAEKLLDRCELTGRLSYFDLPDYLARADIALEPKLAKSGEGSGKMINYMAAGLPVVGFDTANNRGFVEDPSLLAAKRDIEGFVAILDRLIDDPELRRRTGEQNQARVRSLYNWHEVAGAIRSFYLRHLG